MRSSSVKRALAISLAIGLCTAPVIGQVRVASSEGLALELGDGPVELMSFGGGMRAIERQRQPVTRIEMERYSQHLGLDVEQSAMVLEMFAGFEARVQELNGQERQLMMDFASDLQKGREEGIARDPERMRRMAQQMEERRSAIASERESLGQEFLEDLKLVLKPDQIERWDSLERMRKRERNLSPGTFPGEDIDLVELCEGMELEVDPLHGSGGSGGVLEEILRRYEIEIDRLLQMRMDVAAEHPMARATVGGVGFGFDMESMRSWQEKHHDAALRLQRAQQKYVRQVAAVLTEDSKKAFESKIRELSYPMVLGASGVESQFEAIFKLDDLDGEQRARLTEMREAYSRAKARLDDAWIRAIDADLAAGGAGLMMPGGGNFQIFVAGDRQDSDLSKARAARRALDDQWVAAVRGQLRPEQAERVPSPRTRRPGMVVLESSEAVEGGVVVESITIGVTEDPPSQP